MNSILRLVDPMSVVGISVRTNNQNESNADTSRIAKLWERFFKEDIASKIPNQILHSPTYGVYSSYESDYNGEYTVTAGIRVSKIDDLPQDLVMVNIEGGDYLVFEGKGSIPEVVIELWKEIWNYFSSEREFKRKHTTDFELYKESGEVTIHIAVA